MRELVVQKKSGLPLQFKLVPESTQLDSYALLLSSLSFILISCSQLPRLPYGHILDHAQILRGGLKTSIPLSSKVRDFLIYENRRIHPTLSLRGINLYLTPHQEKTLIRSVHRRMEVWRNPTSIQKSKEVFIFLEYFPPILTILLRT